MSKTLKTYPDGSELNTTNLIALVAVTAVVGAISGYTVVKLDEWKTRRIMKKHNMTPR